MLFVNVFRACAFVMYQVDDVISTVVGYFLYFSHQEWPVVAAWEVSSNDVKSIIV